MRYFFLFSFLLFFFVSCSNVNFVSPQPEGIKSINKIPEYLHGTYKIEDEALNTQSYVVTDSKIGDNELFKNIIIKQRGNYFYLNFFKDENIYLLYVVKVIKILDYEDIEISFLTVNDNNRSLFDIINIEEIKEYENEINQKKNVFKQRPDYILDRVSINQLNLLINSSKKKSKLIRID